MQTNAARTFARLITLIGVIGITAAIAPGPAHSAERLKTSYPGVITLDVDASDVDRRIFRVRETIPVQPGSLTLLYPQWIPGTHAPSTRIWLLAGLKIAGAGKDIAWSRDPTNMFAFTLDVPRGVNEIQAEFQYLSPLQTAQGPVIVTPEVITMAWHNVLLYPAGVHSDGIQIRSSVKLPSGWQFASSLDVDKRSGDTLHFAPVSVTDLVDSPVWAGSHFRRVELDPGSSTPVWLDVFADVPESLNAEPEHIAAFRAMVQQAYKVFGAPNFRRYELLLALHDHVAPVALEHQSSTQIRRPPGFFTKWKTMAAERPVFPHEFVHVWIGKKHRPEELATPNFNVPMNNALLWSYEGETEFWAQVLAARSGLLSKEQTLGSLARIAQYLDARAGRSWRSFQDTTNDPAMRHDRTRDWLSWQRSVDYYGEGVFLWLEVDARLRELTDGKRSMNDFAGEFHGRKAKAPGLNTYRFDDVVKALNEIAPDNWDRFLRERLDSKTRSHAIEALKSVGWRVVLKDKPNEYSEASDRESGVADFVYSLGFAVGRSDVITGVAWEGPAFQAGMAGGATLLAVNGRAYKADLLKSAITAAKDSGAPISLLLKSGDMYKTVTISSKGGLRYPHLERIPDVPDRLTPLLEPLP